MKTQRRRNQHTSCSGRAACAALIAVLAVLLSGAPAAAQRIIAGSANNIAPGAVVGFDVRLESEGRAVFATQNDIVYDAANLTITSCELEQRLADPPFLKTVAINFLPDGCENDPATQCERLRVLVEVSHGEVGEAMPQDTVLYRCTVNVSANAPRGANYPLHLTNALASDPVGNAISLGAVDGRLVIAPAPGPGCP